MFKNTWSPENETGIVNLGVAENTLMVILLAISHHRVLE